MLAGTKSVTLRPMEERFSSCTLLNLGTTTIKLSYALSLLVVLPIHVMQKKMCTAYTSSRLVVDSLYFARISGKLYGPMGFRTWKCRSFWIFTWLCCQRLWFFSACCWCRVSLIILADYYSFQMKNEGRFWYTLIVVKLFWPNLSMRPHSISNIYRSENSLQRESLTMSSKLDREDYPISVLPKSYSADVAVYYSHHQSLSDLQLVVWFWKIISTVPCFTSES